MSNVIQTACHDSGTGSGGDLIRAIERFIHGRRQTLALERLLWSIGEILELDRVMLATVPQDQPDEERLILRAEWHSRRCGPRPELQVGQSLPSLWDEPLSAWIAHLRAGAIIEGPVRERPPEEQRVLESLGFSWLLALPVVTGERFTGMLVMIDCHRERSMSPQTRDLLRLCGTALGCQLDEEEAWRRRLERDRLATMGRLAARVAHEINNPLAGIRNILLLLHREMEGKSKWQARLALVDRELDRVGRIIRRLFELHRNEEVEPAVFSCRLLLEELKTLLDGIAQGRGVRLELVADRELRLNLPESLLREVLSNLILNAIEASPEQAVVEIALEVREGQPVIEVRDRGCGLPEEEPGILLEPFYTTKEETGGLGLGLAISREIVQYMKGELQLSPRPGGGTVAMLNFSRNTLVKEKV